MAGGVINHGHIFNTAKTNSENILSSDILPERSAALRVTIGLSSADSTLAVRISDGATTESLILNSATALTAGNLYTFVLGCHPEYTYNFRLGTSSTVDYFHVDEIQGEVL